MELTYRRNAGKSFMVIGGDDFYPDYQIEMCKRNRIEPFLAFETVVADGQLEFWYDITGKQSLEEYVKHKKLESRELELLIKAVYRAVGAASNYLLSEDAIWLAPKYLFVTNSSKEIAVCFCPLEQETFADKFRTLMEYILACIDHEEERAVTISYRMYQITLEPNYGIDDIWKLFGELGQTKTKPDREEIQNIESQELTEEESTEETGKLPFWEQWKMEGKRLIREGKRRLMKGIPYGERREHQMIFEPMEETIGHKEHQTIFLGKNREEQKVVKLAYLGEEPGRDVVLDREFYCIGNSEDADIVIQDETVSRLHARINKADGVYYIEDLNSRNGTWVNGKLLHYMEKIPLKHEDVIAFSTEKYRYEEEV